MVAGAERHDAICSSDKTVLWRRLVVIHTCQGHCSCFHYQTFILVTNFVRSILLAAQNCHCCLAASNWRNPRLLCGQLGVAAGLALVDEMCHYCHEDGTTPHHEIQGPRTFSTALLLKIIICSYILSKLPASLLGQATTCSILIRAIIQLLH